MKKLFVFLLLILMLTVGIFISSCNSEEPSSNENSEEPSSNENGVQNNDNVTKYTVSFNSNGGSEVIAQSVEENKKAKTPTVPTKDGYTFVGWYNGNNKWSFSTPITEDITLFAEWELANYSITYTGLISGATHTNPSFFSIQSAWCVDGKVTLSDPTVPFGYRFDGWFDENNNKITEVYLKSANLSARFTLLYPELSKFYYTELSDGTVIITGLKTFTDSANINIPKCASSISVYAFKNQTQIKTLTVPDSVKDIGMSAFEGCTGLSSVTIGNGLTSIEDSAFKNCHNLTSLTLSSENAVIANNTFTNCYRLIEVVSNTSLNIKTGNSGHRPLEIHAGKSKIVNKNGFLFYTYNGVNYLFDYIGSDTSITLPSDYNGQDYEIYKYTFYNDGITNIVIPSGVTGIGDYAFYNCADLLQITVPDSVKFIGNQAFYDCKTLKRATIGNGVTDIGEFAFFNCIALADLTLGNNVKIIRDRAFYGCDSLTSVTLPNTVTQIGNSAFHSCYNITELKLGSSIEIIGHYAFYGLKISSVTLPVTLSEIGDYAFANCTKLKTVNYRGTEAQWNENVTKAINWHPVLIPTVVFEYSDN